jgi:hypothetical protein
VAHRLGFIVLRLDESVTLESHPHGLLATIGPLRGPRHVFASEVQGLQAGATVASPQMPLQILPQGGGFWVKLHFAWKQSGTHARHQAVAVPAVWPEISVTPTQLETLRAHGYQALDEKERADCFGPSLSHDSRASLKRHLRVSTLPLAHSCPTPLASEHTKPPPYHHPYWRCRAEVVQEHLADLTWTPWPPERATCVAVLEVESLGQRLVSTHWRHLRVQLRDTLHRLKQEVHKVWLRETRASVP